MTTQILPAEIDFAAMAPQSNLPAIPQTDYQRREALMLREYERMQFRLRENENRAADFDRRVALRNIRLGIVTVAVLGGVVWQVAATFNPHALAISAVVTGVVGALTYPGKKRRPASMKPDVTPATFSAPAQYAAGAAKTVIVNVNVNQQ